MVDNIGRRAALKTLGATGIAAVVDPIGTLAQPNLEASDLAKSAIIEYILVRKLFQFREPNFSFRYDENGRVLGEGRSSIRITHGASKSQYQVAIEDSRKFYANEDDKYNGIETHVKRTAKILAQEERGSLSVYEVTDTEEDQSGSVSYSRTLRTTGGGLEVSVNGQPPSIQPKTTIPNEYSQLANTVFRDWQDSRKLKPNP